MSKYNVLVLESAEQDLRQIFEYIRYHDSLNNAKYVFGKIKEAINSLETMPYRGSYPSELYELGMTTHRQINFKPYRIIYTVDDKTAQVFIEIVIDGRRNIKPILMKRITSIE